ncbi:MAG: hypothetical protein P8K66_01145 [Planctomycetota bacterium]|nr:hypothetical protein [Planctomycetota bacterium]
MRLIIKTTAVFMLLILLLVGTGCQKTIRSDEVVSNSETPVQKLIVEKGNYLDLRLPPPAIGRWWAVDQGARPYLHPKLERDQGMIRLLAVKPGKTRVTCVLTDRNLFKYRKVVVDVEILPQPE